MAEVAENKATDQATCKVTGQQAESSFLRLSSLVPFHWPRHRPPARDAAMEALDRVRKEATTRNPVGNAFDSLQRQGRINFYPQPIFVRENGNPVFQGWT